MSEQPSKAFRVTDWKKHFETAESRKYKRLTWISLPNNLNSRAYARIMMFPNGIEIYGVWCALLALASQCNPRGTLIDEGEPLTTEDMSLKTRIPEEKIVEALGVLTNEKIKWLEKPPGESSGNLPEPSGDLPESPGIPEDGRRFPGAQEPLPLLLPEPLKECAPQPPEGECNHSEGNSDSSNEKPEAQNETSDSRKKIPDGLIELVYAWNELPDSICSSVRKIDSDANLKGWAKVNRDSELREILSDIPALILKIRGSPFLHGQSFFKFTWLFGKKNHEWNLTKITDGNYEQSGNTNRGNGPSRDLEERRQAAQASGTEGTL